MGVFDQIVKQQQQKDNPGVLTPQDQARQDQSQTQGGGWVPPPGYLQGNTSGNQSGTGLLQRAVLDRVGQSIGTYIPDPAAGSGNANPNSIFTAQELRKSETAKNYATTGLVNEKTTESQKSFANEQQDRLETRAIQSGLRDATVAGGYTGAVNFLKQVDPKQAMQFDMAKTQLDKNIMENQTYQMAHQNDKLKVMMEGYGALGNMGMAILQAKPEDRNAMYQQILPMVRQVNPNAPTSLNADAVAMFGLAQFQATDANKIANGPAQQQTSSTNIGNIDIEIKKLMNNGATPQNNSQLTDLLTQRKAEQAKATQAVDMANMTQWNLTHKSAVDAKDDATRQQMNWKLNNGIQTTIDKESKPFLDSKKTFGEVNGILDQLSKDPNNTTAQLALSNAFARMSVSGRVSNYESMLFRNPDGSLAQGFKTLENWVTAGGKTALLPNEIGMIKNAFGSIQDSLTADQVKTEQHYKNNVLPNYFTVDEKGNKQPLNINFPASAPQPVIDYLKGNPSQKNIDTFKASYHYDPSMYLNAETPTPDSGGR